MTNGLPDAPLQHHGSKASGERAGSERQQEVVARQWTASHLQDEMRYIREVSGHKGSKEKGLQQLPSLLGVFLLHIVSACCVCVSMYR